MSCSTLLDQRVQNDATGKPPGGLRCDFAITVMLGMLGERIRIAIEKRGLKDNWVAEGAGISKTALSNIINGVTMNPGVLVVAGIADVLGESVDALLGRPGHPLLKDEQDTLRTAAKLINERILPPPNEQKVARTPLPRRGQRFRRESVPVGRAAATPKLQLFTDVRELPRHEIPKDLRERGIDHVFTVDGESMIGAGIEPGDVLYIRSDIRQGGADGQIVVVRYGDFDCVKRLRVSADGGVLLASEPPRTDDVTLSPAEATELKVYGAVVERRTRVRS